MEKILDFGQKHILRLIARDKTSDGWATVSAQLYNVIRNNIPSELATFETVGDGGRVKLTDMGNSVVSSMAWL